MGGAGSPKDGFQEHLPGLHPFLPPRRERSEQAALGTKLEASCVLLDSGEDSPSPSPSPSPGPARGRWGWGKGVRQGRKCDLDHNAVTDDVLQNCTLEAYIVLLTNVAPINFI